MKLQFKVVIRTGLFMFLTTIILINWQACHNKEDNINLKYKFEQDNNHLSTSRLFVILNVHKILLPPKKDSSQIKNSLSPFNKDILLTNIRDMFASGKLKIIELELTKDISEKVSNCRDNLGDIAIKSEVNKIILKANGEDFPLGDDLASTLKIFLGGEQLRKRSTNGDWQDFPRIMGFDLKEAAGNPYINKLLVYLKNGFSYPEEKIKIGHEWNNDLHISMPLDSMTKGQSQGFINLDIKNKRKLVKIKNDIANLNFEFSIKLNWDVTVTGQGYSKCSLIIEGKGYEFFDLKKGWDYGMFYKGDIEFKIDAETIGDKDKNKKIPIFIDATGKIETANKLN